MSAPVLLTSTWNSTAHVLTLTWDQTVTYSSEAIVIVTDTSGATWRFQASYGTPLINGASIVMQCATAVATAGTLGTVSVEVGLVASVGGTLNAAYTNFATTTYGGAVPTTGVPTIGTYDEYMNVYSVNSNSVAAGSTQGQIQFFLDSVNLAVSRFCGISFNNAGDTQQTFTERCDGTGSNTIRVRNVPVVSVTSVTVLSPDGSTDVLDSSTYRCQLSTGTISRTTQGDGAAVYSQDSEFPPFTLYGTQYFPEGFQNISVVYTGTYTTAPADLRWVVYQLVDDALGSVGIRGTKDMPTEDDIRKKMVRLSRPFERIVM